MLLERLRQATSPGLEVERELGSGAMGVVFLGRDTALDRPVAIKVLRPEVATAVLAERFLREARLLAKLDHPNIVRIYQAGQADGLFYFVMDRIVGETLAERLARGPLPPAEVSRLGRDILGALAVIHRAGIVHRDLKPGNILLAGDRALVTDFGIAREDADLPSDLTTPGLVFGSPAYMAPEQAMGLPATTQSDLYSVGATLYEAASGHLLKRSDTDSWLPIPSALTAALQRALELEPARRWPSAKAFHEALGKRAPRRRLLAVGGLVVIAAVVGTLLWRGRTPGTATPSRAGVLAVPRTRADSAARELRDSIQAGLLKGDHWFPTEALPTVPAALRHMLVGERAYAAGQWEDAEIAFREAERVDASCLICDARLEDASRWMMRPADSIRIHRLRAAIERFPPPYQLLIRATQLPIAERLEALEAATRTYRDFDQVWYRYFEELFHRGPLVGGLRSDAREVIRYTLRIRPEFIPAWNHLAWIAIAEGDSVEADSAMRHYQRLEPGSTGVAFAQLALVRAAFLLRFGAPSMVGPVVTGQLAGDPRLASSNLLLAGPRMLLGFEAWRGALWFGNEFASSAGTVERARAGLIAVALAQLALGRPDSMAVALARLGERVHDDAIALFVAGLPAVAALAGADSLSPAAEREHAARLRKFLDQSAYRPGVRRAAAFLLAAVAIAGGSTTDRDDAMAALAGDEELAVADRALVELLRVARDNGTRDMDRQADSILTRHPQLLDEQPVTRAVMRFAASGWLARQHRIESAAHLLHWVEHQDVPTLPSGAPVAAEIDWALTPFARWREARLVDRPDGDHARACRLFVQVEAAWRGGDATFRAKAEEARRRTTSACGGRQ